MAILDQIGLDLGQGNTDYYLADAQARANEAADYDPTATYAVNDLCMYEGVLKQCTTAIPVAEAWDATHWRTVTIGGQIVALRAPFTGATDNTDGAPGLVPQPSRGDQNKFLCANGLWVTISAGGTSLGFLPLIATLTAQDWVESSGNYVARIHDTAIISQMTVTGVNFDNAVNVPARVNVVVDGANHDVVLTTTEAPSVSVVAYIALTTDGSTVMEDVSELTTPFIGATSSTDGRQGLAPKPFIADRAKFLKGDGNWDVPQASEVAYGNTTVGAELGDLNDQIVNLQNGKINKNSGYVSKSIANVFTTFNGVTINSGAYAINEELRHVSFWLSLKLPALTHDTKILEIASSEPAPKYLVMSFGAFALDQTIVNGISIETNARDVNIVLTQTSEKNFFTVSAQYFY